MNNKLLFLIIFFMLTCLPGLSQKQLIILKNENVKLRLYPGDEIIFKLKNSKRIWKTYINNLSDTSVVTHSDTIAFYQIERMYFHQLKFYNRLGSALVAGGSAFFLIDQFNEVVVQQNDPSLDHWVSSVSLSSIIVGLPMMMVKKKSQRMNYKHRLLMVKKGSPFYRPDTRGAGSAFIIKN